MICPDRIQSIIDSALRSGIVLVRASDLTIKEPRPMYLDRTNFNTVLEAIEKITDRDYTWRELFDLCPCPALAVFEGLGPIPGRNLLQLLALVIGADVWKVCLDDNSEFLFHRLKVCVRQRAIELQKSLEQK